MAILRSIAFSVGFLLLSLSDVHAQSSFGGSAKGKVKSITFRYHPEKWDEVVSNEIGYIRYQLNLNRGYDPPGLAEKDSLYPPVKVDMMSVRDCKSRLNVNRRKYVIELKNEIVKKYQYCENDSDCVYNDEDHYFISRLDKVKPIIHCLDRISFAISTNCKIEKGKDYSSESPLPKPNSLVCEKRICKAIYTGPEMDYRERLRDYRRTSSDSVGSITDETCEKIPGNPYNGREDLSGRF